MNPDLLFSLLFLAFLLILFWAGKVLLKPIKLALKIVFNSAIGIILLWVLNFLGAKVLGVPQMLQLNLFTVLTAGFLGIPGVIILIILKYIFDI